MKWNRSKSLQVSDGVTHVPSQDLVLDLRQENWRVQERVRAVEEENESLREQKSMLDARVLQLEGQVSILLGDHEQHVLSLLNGFKICEEHVSANVCLCVSVLVSRSMPLPGCIQRDW